MQLDLNNLPTDTELLHRLANLTTRIASPEPYAYLHDVLSRMVAADTPLAGSTN